MAASKKLLNEFSWSFSRQGTFNECQKKYWYTYYGSWEGWPKTPFDTRKEIDPLAAYLYALKQMQHLPMFVGSCVHKGIELFLKNYQQTKKLGTVDELIRISKELFYKGIKDSLEKKWKTSPKKYSNLFEHYYQEIDSSEGLTDAAIKAGEDKIETSLSQWFNSPIVQEIACNKKARWLGIEDLAHFLLHDEALGKTYKIIVVIDFAIAWARAQGSEVAILFDWKTGEESDKTEDQLYSYALFANKVWKFPFDGIILTPFYVYKNVYTKIGYQQEKTLSLEKIQEVETQMIQSCREMTAKLPEPYDPEIKPDPQNFAYTEQRTRCKRCPFKELCSKTQYEPLDMDSLRDLVHPNEHVLQ